MSNPPPHNVTRNDELTMKNIMIMTNNQQLELELPTKPAHRPARHQRQRRRRLPGAHWWFSQMRQAVANAVEWSAQTERTSRPEQVDLLCPNAR